VALFLMDYQNRARLKILGHARVEDARAHPELVAQLADPKMQQAVERLVFIDVVSFDWNCPKYITPRYSAEEVEELAGPLRTRITELEAELRAARTRLGSLSA
jgi:predicted pyridoxine 5'-phosphate oxidase superfamily flavin-nucleotide-binding protein